MNKLTTRQEKLIESHLAINVLRIEVRYNAEPYRDVKQARFRIGDATFLINYNGKNTLTIAGCGETILKAETSDAFEERIFLILEDAENKSVGYSDTDVLESIFKVVR